MAGRWVGVVAALVGVGGVRRSTPPEESLGVIQSLLEKHPGTSTIALDALQKVQSLQQGENLGSWTPGVEVVLQEAMDKLQTDVADKILAAHQELQRHINEYVVEMENSVNYTLKLKGIADVQDESWYQCVEQAKSHMSNVTVQQRMFNQMTHDRQIPCAQEIAMHGTSLLSNSTAQDCLQSVSRLEGHLKHQVDWLVKNDYASDTKCTNATEAQADQLGMVNLSQSHWATQNLKCRACNSTAAICRAGRAAQGTCLKLYAITQLQHETETRNNLNSLADMQQNYSTTLLVKCLLKSYRAANFTEQTVQDCRDNITELPGLHWHNTSLQSAIVLATTHGVTCTASTGSTADKVIFHGRYWSKQPDSFEPQTYTGAEPSPEDKAMKTYVQKQNPGLPFNPNPAYGEPFSVCVGEPVARPNVQCV